MGCSKVIVPLPWRRDSTDLKAATDGSAIIAIRIAWPSGQCARIGRNASGVGQAMGESSFFTIPSASATAWPNRTASMNVGNATIMSIQFQAGASGISSAVIRPVVP